MTDVTLIIEDLSPLKENRTTKLIKIAGELDETNIDDQMQKVYEVIGEHPANLDIIFDFQDLGYLNSKAIGYLTDIYGKLSETNGKVAIFAARPNVLDTLQVVGLTQLLNMYDSLEQAKQGIIAELTAPTVETSTTANLSAQALPQTQNTVTPETNNTPTQVPVVSVQTNEPVIPIATPQAPTAPVVAPTPVPIATPQTQIAPTVAPQVSTVPVEAPTQAQIVPVIQPIPVVPVVSATPIVTPQAPTAPTTPQAPTASVIPVAAQVQVPLTVLQTQAVQETIPANQPPTVPLAISPIVPTPIQENELEGSNQDQSSYSFEK